MNGAGLGRIKPMMRHLLLAAALVLGQTFAVAHAAQHDTKAPAHECALCVHVTHLDIAAGPAAPVLMLETAATRHRAVALAERIARPFRHYRSRGPPASSLI